MSGSSRVHYLLLAINSGTFGNSNLVCKSFFYGIRGYQFWAQWNVWLANFVEYVLNSKIHQSILRLKWCNFKEFIDWPMKVCFLWYSLQLVPGKSSPELISTNCYLQTYRNWSEAINMPFWMGPNEFWAGKRSRFPPRIRWGHIYSKRYTCCLIQRCNQSIFYLNYKILVITNPKQHGPIHNCQIYV